jgi:phosphate-selective porin
MRRTALGWIAATGLAVAGVAPASAQTLRVGDAVRLTPTARLDTDLRADASRDDDVDVDLARRRVGVTGRVTSHVEFEVEREIGDGGRWRDTFVNLRANREFQVRAGHFKVPFSREQLTGPGGLDFIDRSRAVDLLAPGRSAGVALHGRVADGRVGYDVAGFVRDGTRNGLAGASPTEPTVATRVTIRPLRAARRGGSVTSLEIGAAAAVTELAQGRASLRGRLTTEEVFFAPVLVSGRRLRVGGDLDWRPGPFGIRAEFLRADDARHDQGLLGETLPPLRAQGWYVSGVWAVVGHKAHAKANDGLAVAGLNGLELAVRAEGLSFGTPGAADLQLWTPRAEQLSWVTERAWTVGVNWTLNRLVRVQANAVRENVVTRARGATVPGAVWSPVVRIQVAM